MRNGPPFDYPDLSAEVIAAKVAVELGIIDHVSTFSLGDWAVRVREVARRGIEAHARYGVPLPTQADLEAAANPTHEELCEYELRRRMLERQRDLARAAEKAGIDVGPHPAFGPTSPLAVLKSVHAQNPPVAA